MSTKESIKECVVRIQKAMEAYRGKSVTLAQASDILTNLQKCTAILKDLDQISDEHTPNLVAEKANVQELIAASKGV